MTEISLANLAKGLNLTFKVRLGLSMAHNPGLLECSNWILSEAHVLDIPFRVIFSVSFRGIVMLLISA